MWGGEDFPPDPHHPSRQPLDLRSLCYHVGVDPGVLPRRDEDPAGADRLHKKSLDASKHTSDGIEATGDFVRSRGPCRG